MAEEITQEETRRLEVLASYGVLDRQPPSLLAGLVARAASLFRAPYAALSFVDNNHERFMVTHGANFIPALRRESFGDRVVRSARPLVTANAMRDPELRQLLLVRQPPGIHFYAGVPVFAGNGNAPIGVLAVMDRATRHASEEQMDALANLARRVETQLEEEHARQHASVDMNRDRASDGHNAFRELFESLPDPYLLLEPSRYRVLAATDAFLAQDGRRRDDVVGKTVLDVFPADASDPDMKANARSLRESLDRVRDNGLPDRLPVQRYWLRDDVGRQGREKRFRIVQNVPAFDASGHLRWIIHHAEDVTEYISTRQRGNGSAEDSDLSCTRADEVEASMLRHARELKRLNDRLRMAHRVANIASWEIRIKDNKSMWSDELFRMLGLPPQSAPETFDTFMQYVHPDDRDLLARVRQEGLEGNLRDSFEHRLVRADGEIRYLQERAELVRDADGRPELLYGTVQDITEHKRTQENLAARARQQAVIAKLGQQALETGGLPSLWNEAVNAIAETFDIEYCALLQLTAECDAARLVAGVGWKADESGERELGIERGSQIDFTLDSMSPVVVGDLRTETRFKSSALPYDHDVISGISTTIPGKDAHWGVLVAHATRKRDFSDEDVNFFQSVANVIAATIHRSEDSERVRESEERFRIVAKATADTVWDWNLQTDRVWWNEGIQAAFGYEPDDLEPDSRSFSSRIHREDRENVLRQIQSVLESEEEYWQAEYGFVRADGSVADVDVRGFVIRDGRGRAMRMVGSMDDITLKKEYETRLREQAELLDKAQDAIVVCDPEHHVTYWNKGAERLYGWTAEEICGHSSRILYEDETVFRPAIEAVLANKEWTGEFQQRRKDGSRIVVQSAWTLLTDDSGKAKSILAINTDITERVALEEQLQQSQRLESVGQLTGGVAHDFNNLLTVILGNAELMLEQLPEGGRMHKLAEMTRTASQRGAELTHRLLAFARRQALAPSTFDVNRLLREAEPLLRRALPETVDVQFVPATDLWNAFADASQLESVILNLVLNARDAMPDGGRLTIETSNAWLDEDYAAQNGEVTPGQYVMIAVCDTGAGILPEHMNRVFDPFFTTKEKGKGTGLGLSMAYGFAKQSQGHIKIYSEPGQGTTVKTYLPRSIRAGEADDVPELDESELQGSERILVVEDNDLVREHAERQLTDFGYKVLTARNGPEALEKISTDEGIDLLFTDVIMSGGMSGRELADQARDVRPKLKVLYTSGYTENAIVHHGRLDEGVHLLQKPYRRAELGRKVRYVLSETPDGSRPGAKQ